MQDREIEAKFLEIDKDNLVAKLKELGAEDSGELLLQEIIFHNNDSKWDNEHEFIRLRNGHDGITMTYKHHEQQSVDGTEEIEICVSDMGQAEKILAKIGLIPVRHQQKYRHKFVIDGVTVDIDTWPKIPTYVELDGPSEESLKNVAVKLGLDWKKVVFEDARMTIENRYGIPLMNKTSFTFDKIE
jgi:adenylate cyclase class 2